jgi:hypothetical protein
MSGSRKRNLSLARQRRIGKLIEPRNKAVAEMRRIAAMSVGGVFTVPRDHVQWLTDGAPVQVRH